MICTLISVSTRGVLYTIIRETVYSLSTVYEWSSKIMNEWEMNPSFVLGDCVGQDW